MSQEKTQSQAPNRTGEFHPIRLVHTDKPKIPWQELAVMCGLKVVDGKVVS